MGDKPMADYRGYQRTIHEIDPTVDAEAVEMLMRLQSRTLDHLPREAFEAATRHAKQRHTADPGYYGKVRLAYAN